MSAERVAEIAGHEAVQSTSHWQTEKHDRTYLTLKGHRRTFRGCQTAKIWVDNRTGDLVHERGRGTTPSEWDESLGSLLDAFDHEER